MVNIAVCDDHPEITGLISNMIKKLIPGCIVKEYSTGIGLLCEAESFQIIFLDILMEGISGIETAKRIRARSEDAIIIFITGIKEYVFDALDIGAFHYLLKPIKEDKLKNVLERAVRQVRKNASENRCIIIKSGGRNIKIDTGDILYMESQLRKIAIHTLKEIITFYGVMSELEQQAGQGFFRCHRGYLVNMAYITEYDNREICLYGGEKISLARDKYQDFVKQYMRYLQSGGAFHV